VARPEICAVRVACHAVWVRLCSHDGASVELRPISYQFGGMSAVAADPVWDANWLVIRGDVRTADGRCWTFSSSCLTTWEAAELSQWLHGVLDGDGEIGKPTAFTEPNLAFLIEDYHNDGVRLRVRFSHESLPDWIRDFAGWQSAEYLVVLEVSHADMAQAAQAWDRERQAFPAR
jgi:hypothetical protein